MYNEPCQLLYVLDFLVDSGRLFGYSNSMPTCKTCEKSPPDATFTSPIAEYCVGCNMAMVHEPQEPNMYRFECRKCGVSVVMPYDTHGLCKSHRNEYMRAYRLKRSAKPRRCPKCRDVSDDFSATCEYCRECWRDYIKERRHAVKAPKAS